MFKVGDKVRRNEPNCDQTVRTVAFVNTAFDSCYYGWFNYEGPDNRDYSSDGGCNPRRWELVEAAPSVPARSTDPATRKQAKPRINKYEEAIMQFLCTGRVATGKELAAGLNMPLNSITPRLAPLRRKGKIKALAGATSGAVLKRDGQTIWVAV